jgi:cytochrome c biogenesis factor
MKLAATILSTLTGIAFGILGLGAAIAGESFFSRAMGLLIGACALCSLGVLVIAWQSRSPRLRVVAAVVAVVFVMVWTLGRSTTAH